MEPKLVQNNKSPKNYWCKLASISSNFQSIFVEPDVFSMGRAASNNFQIKDVRISSIHLEISRKIEPDLTIKYFLEDKSTNGTFLNKEKVGKNVKKEIKNGDEIMLLKPGQVADDGIFFIY